MTNTFNIGVILHRCICRVRALLDGFTAGTTPTFFINLCGTIIHFKLIEHFAAILTFVIIHFRHSISAIRLPPNGLLYRQRAG
jgi:hypothetical protein